MIEIQINLLDSKFQIYLKIENEITPVIYWLIKNNKLKEFSTYNQTQMLISITKKYTFMGNTGVGKSSLLNAYLSKNLFKSGFSFNAVTTDNQIEFYNKRAFIDTPGYDDPKIKEISAQKIKDTLSFNGQYVLIFVVSTSGGRIINSDSKTVKTILDA